MESDTALPPILEIVKAPVFAKVPSPDSATSVAALEALPTKIWVFVSVPVRGAPPPSLIRLLACHTAALPWVIDPYCLTPGFVT